MRRFSLSVLLLATALTLTSCSKNKEQSSASSSATTAPSETSAALTDAVQTTAASNESSEAVSTMPTAPTEASSDAAQEPSQAENEQEDFDSPSPSHFTYRFAPDSVGVRLSGGNYQVLNGDFESVINENGDVAYDLTDYNFDGTADLVVPSGYGASNVLYSVYLWKPESSYFEENPLLFLNPTVDEAARTIICRSNESATVKIVERYTATDGNIEISMSARVDFAALTLTQTDMKDGNAIGAPKIEKFSSTDALEAAFMALK